MAEKSSAPQKGKTQSKFAQSEVSSKKEVAGLSLEDNRQESKIQLKIKEGMDARALSAPALPKSPSSIVQKKTAVAAAPVVNAVVTTTPKVVAAQLKPAGPEERDTLTPSPLPTGTTQFAAAGEAPPPASSGSSSGSGSLPPGLKSGVEQLSGQSMSDVTVHHNSEKPAQLNAHAYAQGTDIHLGPGQEKHLPHEAWHVAQQKQGRVEPTRQMKGKVPINDDKGLEHEADVMGAKALEAGRVLQPKSINDQMDEAPIEKPIIQGAFWDSVKSVGSKVIDWVKGLFGGKKKEEEPSAQVHPGEQIPSAEASTIDPGKTKEEISEDPQETPEIQLDGETNCIGLEVVLKDGAFDLELLGQNVHVINASIIDGVLSFSSQNCTIIDYDPLDVPYSLKNVELTIAQEKGVFSATTNSKASAKSSFDGNLVSAGTADIFFTPNSGRKTLDVSFNNASLSIKLVGIPQLIVLDNLSGNEKQILAEGLNLQVGDQKIPYNLDFSSGQVYVSSDPITVNANADGIVANNLIVTIQKKNNSFQIIGRKDLSAGGFTGVGWTNVWASKFVSNFEKRIIDFKYVNNAWDFDLNEPSIKSNLYTKRTIFKNLKKQGKKFTASEAEMPIIGTDKVTFIKTQKTFRVKDFELNYETGDITWSSAEVEVPLMIPDTPFDYGQVTFTLQQDGSYGVILKMNEKFPSLQVGSIEFKEFNGTTSVGYNPNVGWYLNMEGVKFTAEGDGVELGVEGVGYSKAGGLAIGQAELIVQEISGLEQMLGSAHPEILRQLEVFDLGVALTVGDISMTKSKFSFGSIKEIAPIITLPLGEFGKLFFNPIRGKGGGELAASFPPEDTPGFPVSISLSVPLPPVPGLSAIGKIGASANISAKMLLDIERTNEEDNGQRVFKVGGLFDVRGNLLLEIGAGVAVGASNILEIGGMLAAVAQATLGFHSVFEKKVKRIPNQNRFTLVGSDKKLLDYEFIAQAIASAQLQLIANVLGSNMTLYRYILKKWELGNKGFKGSIEEENGEFVNKAKPVALSASGAEIEKPEGVVEPAGGLFGKEAYDILNTLPPDLVVDPSVKDTFGLTKEKIIQLRTAFLVSLLASAREREAMLKKYPTLDANYKELQRKVKKHTELTEANQDNWLTAKNRARKLAAYKALLAQTQLIIDKRQALIRDAQLATLVLAELQPTGDDSKIAQQIEAIRGINNIKDQLDEYQRILVQRSTVEKENTTRVTAERAAFDKQSTELAKEASADEEA
ncbi:MAG: DUF4157 domain-containing protein [Cyclobacteriaceae bacterium]